MTVTATATVTTTTHSIRKDSKLTLDELRGFVKATENVSGGSLVSVQQYDSQRDGYTVSLTITES